jgi:hypothetical protein
LVVTDSSNIPISKPYKFPRVDKSARGNHG